MLDLRERGHHLPFAMMSGHDPESIDLTRLGSLEGYFGLLSKPFNATALTAAVDKMTAYKQGKT